jgi:hypothetical protein
MDVPPHARTRACTAICTHTRMVARGVSVLRLLHCHMRTRA